MWGLKDQEAPVVKLHGQWADLWNKSIGCPEVNGRDNELFHRLHSTMSNLLLKGKEFSFHQPTISFYSSPTLSFSSWKCNIVFCFLSQRITSTTTSLFTFFRSPKSVMWQNQNSFHILWPINPDLGIWSQNNYSIEEKMEEKNCI